MLGLTALLGCLKYGWTNKWTALSVASADLERRILNLCFSPFFFVISFLYQLEVYIFPMLLNLYKNKGLTFWVFTLEDKSVHKSLKHSGGICSRKVDSKRVCQKIKHNTPRRREEWTMAWITRVLKVEEIFWKLWHSLHHRGVPVTRTS